MILLMDYKQPEILSKKLKCFNKNKLFKTKYCRNNQVEGIHPLQKNIQLRIKICRVLKYNLILPVCLFLITIDENILDKYARLVRDASDK